VYELRELDFFQPRKRGNFSSLNDNLYFEFIEGYINYGQYMIVWYRML
jgi:hypothetical protein